MRALLDLMRRNEAAVKENFIQCRYLLSEVFVHLKILDLELGDEELIELTWAELAKFPLPLRKP